MMERRGEPARQYTRANEQVCDEIHCAQCGKTFEVWRSTYKPPTTFRTCAECAARRWQAETRRAVVGRSGVDHGKT